MSEDIDQYTDSIIKNLKIIKLSKDFKFYSSNADNTGFFHIGYYLSLHYHHNNTQEYTLKDDIYVFDFRKYHIYDQYDDNLSDGPFIFEIMNYLFLQTNIYKYMSGSIFRHDGRLILQLFNQSHISDKSKTINYREKDRKILYRDRKNNNYPYDNVDNEIIKKNINKEYILDELFS